MPGLNGIDATRRILDESKDINVLVMTMHDDDDAVFAAIRAGARGYQLKGAAQDETLRAIRSVANGEAIFGPGIADRLQRFLAAPPTVDPSLAFPQLTDRELEILQLLAKRRDERRDRNDPLPQPEDRPQLRVGNLHKAPSRRPRRSRPRSPNRRARRATARGVTGPPLGVIRASGQVSRAYFIVPRDHRAS